MVLMRRKQNVNSNMQFKVISFGIKRPAGAIIQSRSLFIPISFPCAALSPLPSRICLVLTNLIIMFITNLLPIRSIIAAFVTNLPHSDKSHHPFCAAYTCLSSLSLKRRHFISKRLDKFQSLPSPFIRSLFVRISSLTSIRPNMLMAIPQ